MFSYFNTDENEIYKIKLLIAWYHYLKEAQTTKITTIYNVSNLI